MLSPVERSGCLLKLKTNLNRSWLTRALDFKKNGVVEVSTLVIMGHQIRMNHGFQNQMQNDQYRALFVKACMNVILAGLNGLF